MPQGDKHTTVETRFIASEKRKWVEIMCLHLFRCDESRLYGSEAYLLKICHYCPLKMDKVKN